MDVHGGAIRTGSGWVRFGAGAWMRGVSMAVLLCACGGAPTDETPAGAVTLFLAAMSEAEWNDSSRAAAYHLLAPEARAALTAKASRASALSGRDFHPWEMIVEGRFRMRFQPDPDRTQEKVNGRTGVVTLSSAKAGEAASVPVVREGDRWRIALDLGDGAAGTP